MKRLMVCAALLGVMGASGPVGAEEAVARKKSGGGYIHVVVFTLKKDAPSDAAEQVIADCHTMLAKIASVRAVKAGRPAKEGTPELARTDYDLALLVVVDDFAGLKSYLDDPLHTEFVKKHGEHFDMKKIQIFDFLDQK